jgi:hypothetical protein
MEQCALLFTRQALFAMGCGLYGLVSISLFQHSLCPSLGICFDDSHVYDVTDLKIFAFILKYGSQLEHGIKALCGNESQFK